MAMSLRSRIVLISSLAVTGALALSGVVIYIIVLNSTLNANDANLSAIAASNSMTITQWVNSKERAVTATATVIAPGDPQHYIVQMARGSGFGVATAGWSDKTFVSTSAVPAGYDPTTRPWFTGAMASDGVTITKPYADAATGVPYVAFVAPVIVDAKAVGAVSGAVTLDAIRDVVNAVHPTPSSLAFVVSREGVVIAHPDAKLTLKSSSAVATGLSANLLAQLSAQTKPYEAEICGAQKLLLVRAVRGANWYLVVALDEREATIGLRDMLKAMLLTMVALTLAVAGIAALATNRSLRRLGEVRDAMEVIASGDGDLTQRLPVIGNNEVSQISASFNGFVGKVDALLGGVKTGVEAMQQAAAEIETGNRDLSQRTEQSASSLQETSAALTELAASVRASADSSTHATHLAVSSSEIAKTGGVAMSEVGLMMGGIARSSASIADITGIIESIAFQTNILALNAAVEAARAGDSGRGFSVVAAEVRILAQRSATAAADIKHLIEASTVSVREGVSGVTAAGETIQRVVSEIERVSRIVAEIEVSMEEQSAGITQIDRSVAEMDRATQQNAALVEQSAAASAQLNDQAQHLAELVGCFKLTGNAA